MAIRLLVIPCNERLRISTGDLIVRKPLGEFKANCMFWLCAISTALLDKPARLPWLEGKKQTLSLNRYPSIVGFAVICKAVRRFFFSTRGASGFESFYDASGGDSVDLPQPSAGGLFFSGAFLIIALIVAVVPGPIFVPVGVLCAPLPGFYVFASSDTPRGLIWAPTRSSVQRQHCCVFF